MSDYDEDEQQKESKRKYTSEELVIQNVMKDEHGRRYMWARLQRTGVFENMFDQDPIQHAYNAGLRAEGITLRRELEEAAPQHYVKMIEENIDG